MLFDPNQTQFASEYQRIVWQFGTHLVPPEISLADVADPEIREGCMQVYGCTMEILADMYNNPEDYAPEPPRWYTGDYLAWLAMGRTPIKHHRENLLRCTRMISKFGFSYDESTKTLANARYPLFVEYFTRLVQLAKECKQNLGGYLDRRDFRLFARRVVLMLDDLLRPLSDAERAFAMEMHAYAIARGMKMEMKSPYTFRYVYKKLYSLELHNHPFEIAVPYSLDNGKRVPGQLEAFLAVAESQPDADALVRYIQGGIRVCTACNGTKKANERCQCWVDIRGARRLSAACHPTISKYRRGARNPAYTEEDIQMLKRMMDIRIEQVDQFR